MGISLSFYHSPPGPLRTPLTLSQSILHGAELLHKVPLPSLRRPPHPPSITIRTLNIKDSTVFRLAQAIWVVERGGFDVMVLIVTDIQYEAYSYNRLG